MGDVLHNLRSSLDLLWRAAWYPDGGGEDDRSIEFPIFASADGLNRIRGRGAVRKAAGEVVGAPLPDYRWGAHLWRATDKTEGVDVKGFPVVEMSFGDCDAVRGKPIVPTLHRIADHVDMVVTQFVEAGLIRYNSNS